MLKILRQISKDVKEGENLDLYLIVLISIPLVILNLFGIALSSSQPIVLGVLTLLAISSLVNRRKLDFLIERSTRSIDDVLLQEIPNTWVKDLENAKEIWLIGINLGRTIPTYYPILQERINAKAKIKVLIVSPDGIAYSMLVQRANRSVKPEHHQALINSSLSDLCKLKEMAPSRVEIRTIDFPPPFGVFSMDIGSPEGVMYIEYYPYKSKSDMPAMIFHQKEKFWYNFYSEQILKLWESSTEWQCPKN